MAKLLALRHLSFDGFAATEKDELQLVSATTFDSGVVGFHYKRQS